MELQFFENKEKAMLSLLSIEDSFKNLKEVALQDFEKDKTAVVFVDVIKGFVSVGALATPRANAILTNVQELNEKTPDFHKIYFVDCHTEKSTEFSAYVPHCIAGTEEVELVPELVPQKGERSHVIRKNSTNGFMAKEFQDWLMASGVTNFIITGLVTDICVMTFALTLKTYFNEQNIPSRLVVPLNAVETFDLDMTNHQADMMNLFALYNMGMNGIELVKGIRI